MKASGWLDNNNEVNAKSIITFRCVQYEMRAAIADMLRKKPPNDQVVNTSQLDRIFLISYLMKEC